MGTCCRTQELKPRARNHLKWWDGEEGEGDSKEGDIGIPMIDSC